MRTQEEYQKVLLLKKENKNNCEISRITGIPRCTVRDWVNKPQKNLSDNDFLENKRNKYKNCIMFGEKKQKEKFIKAYSYILGLYLGDGYIDFYPRSLRLRIFLDSKYVKLNDFVEKVLRFLFFKNKIYKGFHGNKNCIYFSVYAKELESLFPHLGKGKKYNREIVFEDWQKNVLSGAELLMGLIHSDGCCYFSDGLMNFNFTNMSQDIHKIFQKYCTLYGIKFTISHKNGIVFRTNINKREDVRKLYNMVGNKNEINDFLNTD